MSCTHLQVKSGYSFLGSTIKIDQLVHQVKELNYKAVALADDAVMYGVIPFYKACIANDIKPIIGLTLHINTPNGVEQECVLLAKNNAGYETLLHISSHIQRSGLEYVEWDVLKELDTQALICIMPVKNPWLLNELLNTPHEEMYAELQPWQVLFSKDNFYIGLGMDNLERHEMLQQTLETFTMEYHIPVTALHDVMYLKESDRLAYNSLRAIKEGKLLDGITPIEGFHHLLAKHEMASNETALWKEALKNTEEIAMQCTVTIDFTKRNLPTFPHVDGMRGSELLRKLCLNQLNTRLPDASIIAKDRLLYELDVIKKMEFSDYFLIVADFIQYAKDNGIAVGPGRGSAAGSMVAYVLGITEINPLEYGLLFERFLNPDRITMPDIDIDFSDVRRDEVIQYIKEKYGSEHVAQIITFGTYAARSLLRDLFKVLEVNQADQTFLLRHVPVQTKDKLLDIYKKSSELQAYVQHAQKLQQLLKIAIRLEGLPRHASTHAAGVVISDALLTRHVPLTEGTSNAWLTQYAMNDLESLGLLKIDLLGLRNLTHIEKIEKRIHKSGAYNSERPFEYPEDDPLTYALLKRGQTLGVFQLESQGMQQVLKQLAPSNFEDIVAVNALYRPGPMSYIPTYINRKHKKEAVVYPHPDLKSILETTHGVLVYQEQIMQIAHEIAGMSYGEADVLRRAVSKKQRITLEEQKVQFVNGCLRNGYTKQVADELFERVVKFSDYGFNKSHAVAYSKISYQMAYLKANYPLHFYATLLSTVRNQDGKLHEYTAELKTANLAISGPSINKSFASFSVEKGTIRTGLLAIKGIGPQVIEEILTARKNGPFKSLFDFCLRVSLKVITRQTIETLILAGALDTFHNNRASLLASIEKALEQGDLFKEFGGLDVFETDSLELEAVYTEMEDFPLIKKLADEKELLGIYFSSHPVTTHQKKLRAAGYITIGEALNKSSKKEVHAAGIIHELKQIRTKRGDAMAFVKIADAYNEMEGVLFPEVYRNVNRSIESGDMVVFHGKLENRNGKSQCIIQGIERFDAEKMATESSTLFIHLTKKDQSEALEFLKKLALEHPGNTSIIIVYGEEKRSYKLSSSYYLDANYSAVKELKQFFGEAQIAIKK